MKLIMMWLWTTTWYYKKHHETTCKSMRHFLPTTQPSVSYFKWLWWICSNDASNAGFDAVGKHRAGWRRSPHLPAKWSQHQEWLLWCEKVKSGYPCEVYTKQVLSRQYKYGKLYMWGKGSSPHYQDSYPNQTRVWSWCTFSPALCWSSNWQKKPVRKSSKQKVLWLAVNCFHLRTCGNLPVFQLHPLLPMWFVESLTFFNMPSYGLKPALSPFQTPISWAARPWSHWWPVVEDFDVWLMVAMVV